jgi:hypothetical protein
MSTYEGEHTIFGLLGPTNLTQNDVLQSPDLLIANLFPEALPSFESHDQT